MKILKEGTLKENIERFITKCRYCDTIYKFTEFECDWNWCGESCEIHCPLCGHLDIYESKDTE